jgi:hypothetical protein
MAANTYKSRCGQQQPLAVLISIAIGNCEIEALMLQTRRSAVSSRLGPIIAHLPILAYGLIRSLVQTLEMLPLGVSLE